jgi:hypothetical protein
VRLPPPIPDTEAVPLTLGQLGALVRCLATAQRPGRRLRVRRDMVIPRSWRFQCDRCGRQQVRGVRARWCDVCGIAGALVYMGRTNGKVLG